MEEEGGCITARILNPSWDLYSKRCKSQNLKEVLKCSWPLLVVLKNGLYLDTGSRTICDKQMDRGGMTIRYSEFRLELRKNRRQPHGL